MNSTKTIIIEFVFLKEEELRLSGDPKFSHLAEDLHVEVTAVAPPAEAHARIAYALTEIRRYLVPVSMPMLGCIHILTRFWQKSKNTFLS